MIAQVALEHVSRGQSRLSLKGAGPQHPPKLLGPPICAHTVWEQQPSFCTWWDVITIFTG